MKIAIGNDHGGVELKQHLVEYLTGEGYEVVNFGTDSTASNHYPIFAQKVANAVVSGECERGILICGTGLGISIAANKVKGIRCAHCTDAWSAEMTRRHNNANVLALGAGVTGPKVAERMVEIFLNTEFEGGRHERRVNQMMAVEAE